MAADPCVFCQIVDGTAPATIVREWDDALAFLPVPDPCTDGHTLVVPKQHVSGAGGDPVVAGMVATRAAELAADMGPGDFHLIVNDGLDAGQSVFHLHWHIVPRRPGDRLLMPWDAQPSHLRRLLDANLRHMRQRDDALFELNRLRNGGPDRGVPGGLQLRERDEDVRAERTADAASGQDVDQ